MVLNSGTVLSSIQDFHSMLNWPDVGSVNPTFITWETGLSDLHKVVTTGF